MNNLPDANLCPHKNMYIIGMPCGLVEYYSEQCSKCFIIRLFKICRSCGIRIYCPLDSEKIVFPPHECPKK